jgi:hypothetical protein
VLQFETEVLRVEVDRSTDILHLISNAVKAADQPFHAESAPFKRADDSFIAWPRPDGCNENAYELRARYERGEAALTPSDTMRSMSDEWTCGMGLAQNSALPEKLGELTSAMAELLETHMKALDPSEEEYGAYQKLAKQQRMVAANLLTIADEMAGYHDLPMANHDEEVMASPEAVEAFRRFVKSEEQVLNMLQKRIGIDQEMLRSMNEEQAK